MMSDSEMATLGALVDDGLLVLDAQGCVILANPAAIAFMGARIRQRPLQNFLRHPDFLPALRAAIADKAPSEFLHQTRSPTPRELRVRLRPFGDNQAVLLLTDTSSQRTLDKLRTDFVANVSHELRSPLTTLCGFLETLISDDAEIEPATRRHFLAIMRDEAERMSRLTDDLLTLSQKEADRHVPPTEHVPIVELVEAKIAVLSARLRKEKRRVIIERAPELDASQLQIIGDADEVAMIFGNLLDNAAKYAFPETDIRVRFRTQETATICIDVINACDDIAPEHLSRLTERFYRVDVSRARQIGGTGLGLAIVKHILNRHNAQLHITSEGGTTCFSVAFVLLPEPQQATTH